MIVVALRLPGSAGRSMHRYKNMKKRWNNQPKSE